MIEKRINYRFGGSYQGGALGNTGQSRAGSGRDAGMGMSGKSKGPSRDVSVGVGKGGEGTLADPTEKLDYFGSTKFGPARKFTGSFMDNILGGGYRPVTPTGQFQSRFSQMGGLGKGILGGLISLINPVAGLAYKGIDKLGALRDYGTLADYARGEFGLFQDEDEDEIDTIDIRDKYNRSGIMNPNIRPTQMFNFDPTQFNTRNRDLGELVAEVTQKDIDASKMRGFNMMDYGTAVDSGMISPNVTEYEFEQLKQGNITEPGIYKV